MVEIDEIGIRGIPKESKLLILGDWYQNPGKGWKVVCYFHNLELGYFRKALPVDLLPALIAGIVYPRTSIENKALGWTETFKLPKQKSWQKSSFKNLPVSLRRAHMFADQFENGVLYQIKAGGKTYWLPASEAARMLFFHSSEVVRAAVYQGNTWQLGRASSEDWTGEIELSANIPVRYLNNLQYRKFFTWLLFDSEVDNSFCSIHQEMNRNATFANGADRWIFDLTMPDLSHCEISIAGFTGRDSEVDHVFIREIRSISGIKSPDLEVVYFSHPEDDILLQKELEDGDDQQLKRSRKVVVDIKEIDPSTSPKSGKKRHLVKLGRSGLNFDVELDTRRSPRHVRVLPPMVESNLDELEEQTPEEIGSVQRGSDNGNGPRVDVDNLDPPDLVDAPEKIMFFQAMLEKLNEEYGWKIESKMGAVPKMKCRSQHLIDGRLRRYCHAIIYRDESTIVQILEIELTSKLNKKGEFEPESLSTLFFRAGDTTSTFLAILDELMTSYGKEGPKAMNWKKRFVSQNTTIREYLGHPDNKIKIEFDALESWVARAAEKVKGL